MDGGGSAGPPAGFLIAPVAGRDASPLLREKAGAGLDKVREAAAGVCRTARWDG